MTLEIPDALSFFRLSCGRWMSQRSQHHLLHRRAEAGASFIVVEELLKGDERLAEIAERNNASVEQIVGGCWVRWSGSMAWDRAGESHEDQTMFGLILTTDYEMMSSLERFWFASENVRLRTSTVQGLSNNASFCIETRQLEDADQASPAMTSNGAALAPFGW